MAPTPADGEPSSWASGTTTMAVTVAPLVMVTVYSPVMRDVRRAKCSRMKDGMETLQTARPDIPTTVPTTSMPVVGMPRTSSPPASMPSDSRMAFSTPSFPVSQDVAAPATAKHSVGMEGMSDATSGP